MVDLAKHRMGINFIKDELLNGVTVLRRKKIRCIYKYITVSADVRCSRKYQRQ